LCFAVKEVSLFDFLHRIVSFQGGVYVDRQVSSTLIPLISSIPKQ